jgi:hypothetical protein
MVSVESLPVVRVSTIARYLFLPIEDARQFEEQRQLVPAPVCPSKCLRLLFSFYPC